MSDRLKGAGGVDHGEMRELCAGRALGILDAAESERLEAHLRHGCASCESEIAAHRRTAAALGALLDGTTPPERAETALRARIRAGNGPRDNE